MIFFVFFYRLLKIAIKDSNYELYYEQIKHECIDK